MKNFRQIISAGIFASCIVFSVNSFASNDINNAKLYFEKGDYKTAIIKLKNQLKEYPKDADARFLLAKSYLKIGEIKLADKEITRAYQLNKSNDEIVLTYAQLLLIQRKYNETNNVLDRKFTDSKQEMQSQIYKAYVFLGKKQISDAKQIYSELVEKEDNIQIYNGLARIALLEKEFHAAAKWLEKSLKKEPENIETLQIKATLNFKENNYANALDIYNNLIIKQGNNLSFYLLRAAIEIQLRDFKSAENDIQKVLDKVNKQPQANYMLAQIKLQEKSYKDAQILAQNVLNVVPRHSNSMLILGISNFGQENYNQADKYLTQYLSIVPGNISVQNILANVYLAQKKGEQAVLILEGIDEEQMNKNANILMTLGSAYLLTGEHHKGIEALNKAKKLKPNSEVIQKRLLSGYLISGDIDNAIIGLEKMVDSAQSTQKTNYLLIISYIQKNELQKAENILDELIKKNSTDPALYNLSAVLEKLKGNNQKAIEFYNKAITLNDKFIPGYIGLAELASLKENWISAKNYYMKVIQIDPKYIKAYIYLAKIAEKENNKIEIEKQLLLGFEQAKGDVQSQLGMAVLLRKWYINKKEPKKIMSIAETLNKNYPDNNAVLSFFAGAQIVNNSAMAEQTLKTIIANNNSDVKHRLLLADLIVKRKGSKAQVLELLDSVIAIIPDNPKPVILKAAYVLDNRYYDQAFDVANYALKQFPKLALGYQINGDVYRMEKKLDKALISYQQAYKLEPNHKLLFNISDILIQQGKKQDSLMLLESKLKSDDKDLEIHFKLANIYQKNKQYSMATKHYLKILEIKADNVLALNNLAGVYLQEKNPQALSLARKAYEKMPKSASIVDTYGYTQVKLGDIAEGITLLEKAVSMSPENYDIHFHLAEGYYLNGDNIKARKVLSSFINTNVDFTEKENAKVLFSKLE